MVPLAGGRYKFRIYSRDLLENESETETVEFYIDLVKPKISSLSFKSPTFDLTPTITWDVTDDWENTITYEYSINNGTPIPTNLKECTLSDLYEGIHIFRLKAIDQVGNISDETQDIITIDITKPEIISFQYHLDNNERYFFECIAADETSPNSILNYSFNLDDTGWTTSSPDKTYYLRGQPIQRTTGISTGHPVFGKGTTNINDLFTNLKVKVIDQAGNESDIAENTGSKSKKIICTELYRQGLMDEEIYKADQEFGKYMYNKYPFVMEGY